MALPDDGYTVKQINYTINLDGIIGGSMVLSIDVGSAGSGNGEAIMNSLDSTLLDVATDLGTISGVTNAYVTKEFIGFIPAENL